MEHALETAILAVKNCFDGINDDIYTEYDNGLYLKNNKEYNFIH